MPVARLFALALMFCSALTFAQDKQSRDKQAQGRQGSTLLDPFLQSSVVQSSESNNLTTATPSEPWRIIPEQHPEQPQQADSSAPPPNALNLQAQTNALDEQAKRLLASIPYDPNSQRFWIKASPEGKVQEWRLDGAICYTIRNFLVARDSKDSDSTHPVGSSTCQPANRYSLKSAILNQDSLDR